MAQVLLAVSELEAAYGDQQVLWGVSLEVRVGEIVALIGPNGAGKTTLLRTVAGLMRPLRGSVRFDGEPIDALPPDEIVARGLTLVPEGRRLFRAMTVQDNLELGAYPHRARAQRRATLDEVFALFPVLAERRHQSAGTLSGGEQQMLAIGRALMARPRLLMLDEPSMGLAPVIVERVLDAVRAVAASGVTVLLVEQSAYQALERADRAYVVREGRIVVEGSARRLLSQDDFRRAYIGL
ncbi:MAG: ABC transporter ATP-binding protein [Armatimonadota bacterium]|nr:ABC transporter ATP-binding protein [Armatimonadota bacterium]MDR7520239.1 ABC transporter ATP-binding protein [Armatimonadota bacterium]MDR7549425.1 ABC transporter ATP-binding protein [Armatimonadota bacterium]